MAEIDVDALREATATIRGYIYQFDASILAVLAAAPDEEVTVEGIEDFDIRSAVSQTHGQVKYYESQKLTDSTVRDAILPMIQGFHSYAAASRAQKRYVLYGHFKEAPTEVPTYSLDAMKSVLIRRSYKKDEKTGEKVKIEANLQAEIGISDEDLADFCGRLTVRLTAPFDEHRTRVTAELKRALSVSQIEAQGYSYPSALAAMAALSTGTTSATRTTTRLEFLQKIRPNIAIYTAWALREEGENAYCKKIRDQHFATLNIDGWDRFFVLSLAEGEGIDELYDLVEHIIRRWSSHKFNAKPSKDRYAPIFFFPGLAPDFLLQIKTRLVGNRHRINDGYQFFGASFSAEHLLLPQTKEYPVSARLVSDRLQFESALAEAKRGRLVIELHVGDPFEIDSSINRITAPVNSAAMTKKIV